MVLLFSGIIPLFTCLYFIKCYLKIDQIIFQLKTWNPFIVNTMIKCSAEKWQRINDPKQNCGYYYKSNMREELIFNCKGTIIGRVEEHCL